MKKSVIRPLTTHPHTLVPGVRVELQAVFEPRYLGPRNSPGHADEADLPAQVVALHEVGGLNDPGTLKN